MFIFRFGDENGEMVGELGCRKDVCWGKGGLKSVILKCCGYNVDVVDRCSKKGFVNY